MIRCSRLLTLFTLVLVALLLLGGRASPVRAAVFPAFQATDPATPPVSDFGAALLALAGTVTGIVEGLKRIFLQPAKEKQGWSDTLYKTIVTACAFVISLGAALIGGSKLDALAFIGITLFPSIVGALISGVLVFLGNDIIHLFLNGGKASVDLARAKVDSYSAATDAVNTGQIEALAQPIQPISWTSFLSDPGFQAFLGSYADTVLDRQAKNWTPPPNRSPSDGIPGSAAPPTAPLPTSP